MRHLIPHGVNSAVMAAAPLWMSSAALREKFGRRTAHGGDYRYTLDPEFAVEAFLARIAERPEPAIDPDSLLHLMRAEEYFDLAHDHGSLEAALAPVTARTLFVSYRTDWRYPPEEADVLHRTLLRQGTPSRHAVLDSPLGHGAFLYDVPTLARQVAPFLAAAERSHA